MSPVRNYSYHNKIDKFRKIRRVLQDNHTKIFGISNGVRLKVFAILLFAFVVINQVVTVGLAEESQKRKPLTEGETTDVIIKRLEAMDVALAQVAGSQLPLEVPETELIQKTEEEFDKAKMEITLPKSEFPPAAEVPPATESPKGKKGTTSIVFWLVGLSLTSGLGFLIWLFWYRYRLILNKNMATREITKLKSELQGKNKLFEHEEILRKTIEDASLAREKEFERLKLELQKEAKLLEQEEKARKTIEEELSRKEKEHEQVKDSFESLKEVLVHKGLVKELSLPEEKGRLWIPGKSQEKRQFPRLDLSRDYNRTIILRIESPDKSKSIKSFANNISLGGLCFETRKDFEEKEMINLRLFFFGDKVPMIKIKAEIIWKKAVLPVNYYGVSFASLEEKDKTELNRYIESKISEATTYGMK